MSPEGEAAVLLGRCEVLKPLLSSGGKRLLGWREDGERAALVVLDRLDGDASLLGALEKHAWSLMDLSHPQLLKHYDCEASEGSLYWVSELVSGASLDEVMKTCRRVGRSLPLGLCFSVVHEAALALGALHAKGLGHGDVSEANLLVCFDGTARLLSPGVLDCLHGLPADPRTDVFKLAALLYRCLTGQAPDPAVFARPSSFNHAVEPAVDALLKDALGNDRTRRFKSGDDFARALKQAAGSFMWRAAQRAELMESLLPKRRQRERDLLRDAQARLLERRAHERALAEARARAAAPPVPDPVPEPLLFEGGPLVGEHTAPVALPFELAEAPSPTGRVRRTRPPAPAPRAAPGLARFYAGAAAVLVLVTALAVGLSDDATPLPTATLVAALAPAPKPPPPPPAPAPAVEAPAAPVEEVAETAPSAPPAKKAVKRKKRDDAPLPPWLRHRS